ncbi:MAG: AAA family ATPase, partial [Actinomycetes bacterium]
MTVTGWPPGWSIGPDGIPAPPGPDGRPAYPPLAQQRAPLNGDAGPPPPEPPEHDDEPSPRPKLVDRLLTVDGLATLPPVRPLVDGLLYRRTLAQLSGPPGSYKSFLALGMGICQALGENFEDHKVPQSGPVIYVAPEGANGLRARILAYCELSGFDPARLHDRFYVLPVPVQLGHPVDISQALD